MQRKPFRPPSFIRRPTPSDQENEHVEPAAKKLRTSPKTVGEKGLVGTRKETVLANAVGPLNASRSLNLSFGPRQLKQAIKSAKEESALHYLVLW